jgi:hypothetical protein
MPKGRLGQYITFAIVYDEDRKYSDFIQVPIHTGATVRKILAARGRPDMMLEVARLNKIASPSTVLRHKPVRKRDFYKHHKRLRLPGKLRASQAFDVYADFGGSSPRIVAGYAKLEVIDRPGRTGISHFTGYDPSRMVLPITFDAYTAGSNELLEARCDLLERMAGRGDFHGAAIGSPALLRISTRDNNGNPVWLIPQNYQWSSDNDSAPLWRIADIDWDESPLRDNAGNRTRQHAVVTVEAYTHVAGVPRSVTKRKKTQGKKKKPSKPKARR